MSGPPRCPLCGSGITGAHCSVCGADLDGPAARELAEVDGQMHALVAHRQQVLARLGEEARRSATRSEALPGWSQLPPPLPPPPSPPPPPVAPPGEGTGLPQFLAPYPPEVGYPGGAPAASGPAGPQVSSILLTLGTALLVIAALVFAAVSWNRVGPLGQGALLVGLTLAAGFGTDRAARRALTGTAEALGVLTVLMGPLVAQALRITAGLVAVDDRTWANWGSWTWWPAVIVLVGGAGVVFGRLVAVRSPQWLGSALVQFALPLWTALAPLPTWAKVVIVAAQAGAVGSALARRTRSSATGALWWGGSVAAWGWAAVSTLTMTVDADLTGSVSWPLVIGFASLAAAAATVSWGWPDDTPRRDASATAGLAAGLMAIVVAVVGSVTAAVAWPAIAVVAAVAALVVDRFGGHRRAALHLPCWLLAGAAAAPAVGGVWVALDAARVASEPVWGSSFGTGPVIGERGPVVGIPSVEHNPVSVAVMIVAGMVALLAVPAWRRRVGGHALVASAGVALLVAVPPLAGMSLGATALLLLAAASMVVVAVAGPGGFAIPRPVGLSSAAVLLAVAGVWALGTQPLTMVAVAVALLLACLVVLDAFRADDEAVAGAATAVAATAFVAEVGLVAYAFGSSPDWAVTASALAAAATVAALPVTQRSEERASAATMVLVAASMTLALSHIGAVIALSTSGATGTMPAGPITVALAVGAAAWGAAAVRRPSRPSTAWWAALAGAEALILVWFRLVEASVVVVEAYTLPLASLVAGLAVLLAWSTGADEAGWRERPSWSLEGPALALALWPTALIALGDPGLTREIVGLGLGAAVLAGGAVWRRRAPVDVGGAAVAVLGLQALLPYVAEVPRWISLGLVGIVLVGLGATFEQRRQDFDEARRRYASLR